MTSLLNSVFGTTEEKLASWEP